QTLEILAEPKRIVHTIKENRRSAAIVVVGREHLVDRCIELQKPDIGGVRAGRGSRLQECAQPLERALDCGRVGSVFAAPAALPQCLPGPTGGTTARLFAIEPCLGGAKL